jgi:hypothetical protein
MLAIFVPWFPGSVMGMHNDTEDTMTMHTHILAALHEQFTCWDALLAGLSAEQAIAPGQADGWSIQDVVVHLWAWQQRSIARLEAVAADHEPVFPAWLPGSDPDAEGQNTATNAWIFETYHDRPWPEAYQAWRAGYLRFLELGAAIAEADLLDAGRYAWLQGHPPAGILLASYAHHQEHWDALQHLTP